MRPARELTEHDSVLPLRVDRVTHDSEGPAPTLSCTDIEGTELRVAIRGSAAADPSVETGEWYRFDGIVRSSSPGAELLCPAEDGAIERLDTPERRTHPPLAELEAPWLTQLGASDDVIAVTVQPRPTDELASIRAEDPETFEIGAVCLAHCDGAGDRTVYHREEPDTRDEHLLLEHVVADLSEAAAATLVARGGEQPPLELLHTRLALAADGTVVDAGAEQVLADCFHARPESAASRAGADTLRTVAQQLGIEVSPVSLADYELGIDPSDWRADWEIDATSLSDVSDPHMSDRDYATLVERYLGADADAIDSAQLGQCLKDYASADLSLFRALVTDGVMDHLACPRLAEQLPYEDHSA